MSMSRERELLAEALATMPKWYSLSKEILDFLSTPEPTQDKLLDFCDTHCTWLDHHSDCPLKAKYARTEQEAKREQFSDDAVADSYSQLQPILGEYLKFKAGFRMAEKMHGIGEKHHGIGGGDE